jgi:hypothetical protein
MNMSIGGVGRNTYHVGTAKVETVCKDLIIQDLQQKLLQSQASEVRLRQVLCYWREECTGFEPSISVFALKVDEALSTPPNTAELEAHVYSEIERRIGEPVGEFNLDIDSANGAFKYLVHSGQPLVAGDNLYTIRKDKQ